MMRKVFHYLFFPCNHATLLLEKRDDVSLSLKDRIQLAVHLRMCKACATYEKQRNVIHQALLNMFGKKKEMTEENLEQLVKKIKQKLPDTN
jgi:anti-sigma factor ChrR (cupin superfamily)